jgi:DNA-directed RNA polymerase III subunit RPC1
MLGPEDRASFLKKMKGPSLDALIRAAIFKRITEICKRTSTCPYCGYANGVVKKMSGGFFKIVHEKYRAKNSDDQLDMQIRQMSEIIRLYPDLKPNIQRSVVSFCRSIAIFTDVLQSIHYRN